MIFGASILIVGALVWVLGRFGGLERLPGTLQFQRGNLTCIVPIAGSIILSLLLTLILNLLARWLNR